MGEMYTKHAEKYADAIENNAYNGLYERPSTLALVGEVNNKAVLDLGCGPGVYAQHFVNQGATVTAVDLSEQMVQITKQKLGDAVTCYAQDLSDGLPKEADDSYDFVVCPLMVHYLEDLVPLFKEVNRVLKQGGWFIFSTHHPLVDFEDDAFSNYFAVERITEDWNTVGEPVEVSFFRRSFTNLFDSLAESGFTLDKFSEGQPDPAMKEVSPETFDKLSRRPNFIFIRAKAN
ncbi:class I SAM-dependent DNA methyltransferase [Vibrio barjaei]|jgi:SAM-dependent methyltransferase|uniref:Class I SAM-dependent DNA methyltransferase n=1 Tax=Vibrio barjaei TaxID=1676683 RepID=A0ABW7IHL7_9VIBR|nr:class I SAM-dependent methyltransferase [Vibrio barjaei]MCY9873738.1 class I SAM-dependent methyltransferase [Vibrio barjaei]